MIANGSAGASFLETEVILNNPSEPPKLSSISKFTITVNVF